MTPINIDELRKAAEAGMIAPAKYWAKPKDVLTLLDRLAEAEAAKDEANEHKAGLINDVAVYRKDRQENNDFIWNEAIEEAAVKVANYKEIDEIAHDLRVGNFPHRGNLSEKFSSAIRSLKRGAK